MEIKEVDKIMKRYPEKVVSVERVFSHIRRGNRIFIGTGCGRPQYLLQNLIHFIESHPTALFDAEVFHVWDLGVLLLPHRE